MMVKMRLRKNWREQGFIWIILVPIIIHFVIMFILPVVFSLYISFTNWSMFGEAVFTGLANWRELFSDARVGKSFVVTLQYSLYYIVPVNVIALFLALLVNNKRRGTGIFKAVYFIPAITSAIILTAIWRFIFIGKAGGPVNALLGLIHIPAQLWFGQGLANLTLALMSIFKGTGILMVNCLAGLKGIPMELYEAAVIDGSNRWQSFVKITLPLMKPTLLYTLIISTIFSFQVFDPVYVMTQGGPNYATWSLVYQIYMTAFYDMRMGYASAIAFLLLLIIMGLTLIQYRFLNDNNSYD